MYSKRWYSLYNFGLLLQINLCVPFLQPFRLRLTSHWCRLYAYTASTTLNDFYHIFFIYLLRWSNTSFKQERTCTSVGLTYIHTCRSYVHTPHDILQTCLNFTNGASLAWPLSRRISTVVFTCGWAWPARWLIRPILGFWRSKVHKNLWFPALDADEPPSKTWRR